MTRTATRYGRADIGFDFAATAFGTPTGPGFGTRRARAAALLTLALPGAVYAYQGWNWACRKPAYRSAGSRTPCASGPAAADPGRDGCRVPLPWTAEPWRDPRLRAPPGELAFARSPGVLAFARPDGLVCMVTYPSRRSRCRSLRAPC